jgi:aminoglycoside/choline kinase family phosphotransferase
VRQYIQELYRQTYGSMPGSLYELPRAGSHRRYYRLEGIGETCLGVYSPDPLETRAFLEFTKHFRRAGLPVPLLLNEDPGRGIYLIQDLGDRTLKEEIDRSRSAGDFEARIPPLYREALRNLLRFQVEGHAGLNYDVCVPRPEFDRQSMMWDLQHFKYLFLKLLGIPFNEQALEDDYISLSRFLASADTDHFMYRDFQSRNIMVRGDDLYFIDYQGGRRGALQYDLASILFEARVDLSTGMRDELLEFYLEELQKKINPGSREFMKHYWGFVLIRILQAMGAYGIRGIVENKPLFLQSIPFGIKNLAWLLDSSLVPDRLPELTACLENLCSLQEWKLPAGINPVGGLNVLLYSFSYKKGIPRDLQGNGGGFVFDCRALPNPGREEKFRSLSGKDREVIGFLEQKEEVKAFMDGAFGLVEQAVSEYQSRGFEHLMVSFGCTGGQHRSVYCAERLQKHLQEKYKLRTRLVHRDLEAGDGENRASGTYREWDGCLP